MKDVLVMKKVAIIQSNYIPWKGYFDIIGAVDEFIIYDDMQYTRRDWRNRNLIKTPDGVKWLTVPVRVKGKYDQKIRDTEIECNDWGRTHWATLCQFYRRSAHFSEIAGLLEPLYLHAEYNNISDLNRRFIEAINNYLRIETNLKYSWEYELADGKTERLLSLCLQAGASEYVSGPAARGYLEEELFMEAGIGVSWFNYEGYQPYPQLWGEFTHGVSILDLMFNCGPSSRQYMKLL